MIRNSLPKVLCLFAMILLIASATYATTRYVTYGGSTTGTNWTNVYSSIQAAINDSISGDEVHIKGYSDGTLYNQKIELRSGVAIKGGYTGNGDDRDPDTITTISATGLDDCVVYANGVTAAIIEYCTIKGGAGRLVSSYKYGGGIYCIGSTLRISHCCICNNTAVYGAGIYADTNSLPDIEDCEITSNTQALYGGGLYFFNGICRNNNIISNHANCYIVSNTYPCGGGVFVGENGGTNIVISGNKINQNSAMFIPIGYGGGIYLSSTSAVINLSDNDIESNLSYAGGGIFANAASKVEYCNILNNTIYGGGSGGACLASNSIVNHCKISGNKATDSYYPSFKGSCGGISVGWSCTVTNCEISNNYTESGQCGGISAGRSSKIIGNLISGNRAGINCTSPNDDAYGGGILLNDSVGSICCNVIKDNTSTSFGGGVIVRTIAGSSLIFRNNTIVGNESGASSRVPACAVAITPSSTGVVSLYNNIIADNIGYGLYTGTSNRHNSYNNCFYNNSLGDFTTPPSITQDTHFGIDPNFASDGYHLASDSIVCIDGGYNSAVDPSWLDIDGRNRTIGSYVDIGADEREGVLPFVDIVSPTGTEWHLAPNQSSIEIHVTAFDAENGIASVSIKIGSGNWIDITSNYDESTGTWFYVWNSPASATIQVSATDKSDDSTTISKDVVVSSVNVVYVDSRMAASGAGSSWGTAKKSLVDAVAQAQTGSEIWVMQGKYIEPDTIAPNSGVSLFGGFVGDETCREQRNWAKYPTILDGYGTRQVLYVNNYYTSPSTIDGFTIQYGYITGGAGAGISSTGPVTISHNIIRANSAIDGNGSSVRGAGIYCTGSGYSSSGDSVVITDNWIAGNVVQGSYGSTGGGICVGSGTIPFIVNNTIVDNMAYYIPYSHSLDLSGAAAYIQTDGAVTIKNNIITSNSSGVYVDTSGSLYASNNDILNKNTLIGELEPGSTDKSEDPLFVDSANCDYHIYYNSTACRDTGSSGTGLTDLLDIDCQPRVTGTNIDIGAHEANSMWCYKVALNMSGENNCIQTGSNATVIASVYDTVANSNAVGVLVGISIDNGTIVSVNDSTSGISYDGRSAIGAVDSEGSISIVVTNSAAGCVNVTVTPPQCPSQLTRSIGVWFFDTAGDDWLMFMHDSQHTGMSRTWDVTPETLQQPEWTVDIPTANTTRTEYWSYTYQYDTISHPNPAGNYNSFDYSSYIFQHPYIDSSPVVINNIVIVGTWTGDYPLPGTVNPATGSLVALNAANNGAPVWTAVGQTSNDPYINPVPMGGIASTPCISGDYVYVGSSNGYLYCVELSSGLTIWAQPTTNRSATPGLSPIISSPVVHNGVVYITNEASKVYAFTADEYGTLVGNPIALPINQSNHGDYRITDVRQQNICGASSPAIATVDSNTYLLVGCDDGWLYRLAINTDGSLVSPGNGDQLFMGGCVESSPSVSGKYAYVGVSHCHRQDTQRINLETFTYDGVWNLGEECRATIALSRGNAYVGVDTGHVFYKLFDPTTDPLKEKLPQFSGLYFPPDDNPYDIDFPETSYFVGSAAITTNGTVYVGNDNGHFYVNENDNFLTFDTIDINPATSEYYDGVDEYYDGDDRGFMCSSPAIGYNVDAPLRNRWVFITRREPGTGKLFAFKTTRN